MARALARAIFLHRLPLWVSRHHRLVAMVEKKKKEKKGESLDHRPPGRASRGRCQEFFFQPLTFFSTCSANPKFCANACQRVLRRPLTLFVVGTRSRAPAFGAVRYGVDRKHIRRAMRRTSPRRSLIRVDDLGSIVRWRSVKT